MASDDTERPTCDHRDHAGEDVPAVAQFEGCVPPAGTLRYWACPDHAPEGTPAIKRVDPGPGNRSVDSDTDQSNGDLIADGGKYINPTGEGYLGVYKLSHYSLGIPFGAWPEYTWRVDDDVHVTDADVGIAIVDEKPDDLLGMADVQLTGQGPVLRIPTKAIRRHVSVPPHGDVRVYRYGNGGMQVVPATADPFVDGDQQLLADGGLPDSLEELVDRAERKERLQCADCGDLVQRRYLREGRCIGCRYRRRDEFLWIDRERDQRQRQPVGGHR